MRKRLEGQLPSNRLFPQKSIINADGQRISKTVEDVTTEFFYAGDILAGQKTGDNVLMWIYDNNGAYIGFTYNGVEYYYVYNLQGDVEAITDATGAIVASYTYGAWGSSISVKNYTTNGVNIAQINPIRYRGYYYDAETNFYYLNSRYYDPGICRFINADGYVTTGQGVTSFNMFAYCGNNPVSFSDPQGNFRIQSLLNKVKQKVQVSLMMLQTAVFGNGKHQSYGTKSVVSKTLLKSKIMTTETINNISKFKNSGAAAKTYNGDVSLYGKDNDYDFDLSYSVGKASYSMYITKETKTTGFWVFKKTKSRYVVDVTVSDTYDFDEYRDDKSVGSLMNNLGYDLQKAGVIKPYSWDANYKYYSKWE